MAGYRLTVEAHSDLVEIALYTQDRWGERQEEAYISQLYDRFAALSDNPLLGRPCDDVRPGLRRVEEGSHVVFFERDGDEVLVVRVLHERMLAPQASSLTTC